MTEPLGLTAATDFYNDAVRRAVSRQLPVVDLFGAASTLSDAGQAQATVDLYRTWVAYNGEDPLLYAVYFNYGAALMAIRDNVGAINALRECLRIKPDFGPAHINLGRALEDSGQAGSAVAQWLTLVNNLGVINGESVSHKMTALQQIGRVLEGANNDASAEDALKQSLDINVSQTEVMQHWISLRQRQCKWPALEPWERATRKDMQNGISSLSLACLADEPVFQLAKAYAYARKAIGMPKVVARPAQGVRHDKLRIGYISSDLREHAVGFAMTDVMELHDKDKFEIYAYYCGISRTDATQQRIKNAVTQWTDINGMTDDQAAEKIAADGVDIIIDLNGYTKDARTKVFARRPAPIAVNWFGFPGTMATPYHHYIIADETIIPESHELYYSEKVLRLPCYQPNDRKRTVSPNRPTRMQVGLPENAFVFCSFNGTQKTTPRVFERWMNVLRQVPDSVLWLLTGTADANERLRHKAAQLGVAPDRIIFADKMANPDHLARYPLADLFLDSMPYGAHTTAADSLWMNVPIVTWPGRSFAARVCASLVRAAGVPELACESADAYVALAVDLARNPERLAAIKAKLAAGRDTCTLFDTPALVRGLEDLYRQMWNDYKSGNLPVPDLRNLDVYHDIGVDLDLEGAELLSDEAFLALYHEKLAEWHSAYPIPFDDRLWRKPQQENAQRTGQRAVA